VTDTYTALVAWVDDGATQPHTVEEIDVQADSHADAREKAQVILERDYEAGGHIIDIEGPIFGMRL
jgi:hypothetical protein